MGHICLFTIPGNLPLSLPHGRYRRNDHTLPPLQTTKTVTGRPAPGKKESFESEIDMQKEQDWREPVLRPKSDRRL
jgi:hypothetical protein